MASSAKVFLFTCLLLHISMQQMWCASGSAIPIWEFLTRNEKMSYLYSTFAQLVSVHCKSTASTNLPVNQCKRNLLNYGSEKLQTFTEVELEALDPYQRGANELIWSSIMREHPSGATLLTTRKPVPTPPATSIVILTEQKPSSNSAETESSDNAAAAGEHYYPKNPLFDNDAEHKHQYAMDMDIAYGYGEKPFNPSQVETFLPPPQKPVRPKAEKQQNFLTGPLVFRVRPDGTPVAEDLYKPLPRDDDLEAAYHYTEFAKQAREQSSAAATGSSNRQRRIALQQVLQPPAARRYRHIDAYPQAFYYYPRA